MIKESKISLVFGGENIILNVKEMIKKMPWVSIENKELMLYYPKMHRENH